MRRTSARPGPGTRFLAWVAGLDQLLLGLTMIVVPSQFDSSHYSAFQPHLFLYGVLIAASGIGLLAWQVLPLQRTRLPQASLLAGACVFALLAEGYWRIHGLTGASTYGFLSLGLLLCLLHVDATLESSLGIDFLICLVGIERVAYGALLLGRPDLSDVRTLSNLPSYLAVGGLDMMIAGLLLLIGQTPLGRRRPWLSLMPAAIMLVWAYQVGVRGNLLPALITTTLLAAAVAAKPFFPRSWLAAPRPRIANRLVAVSVLSASAALVILAVALLQRTQSAYEQRATLDQSTTAQVVASDSSAFVDSSVQDALLYSRDPQVLSFDPAQQFAFMKRALAGDPDVSQVSIVNAYGIAVARSPGDQPAADQRETLAGVQQVFQTHQPEWDVGISPTQQVPVLAVRVPILDESGAFEGVYVDQLRLTALTQRLDSLNSDKAARVIIVDSAGRALVHPDAAIVASRADLRGLPPVAAALAGKPAPMSYLEGDRRWFSVQVPVTSLGWTVLVERPESEVLAPAMRAREEALGFLAVMIVLSAGWAVLFARSFSRPLVDLAHAARLLGAGAQQATLPPAGDDEVGELVHAFNDMQERLAARTHERERAEAERAPLLAREQEARAEVEALLTATAGLGVQAEPEEVLRTLVEQAATLLQADLALYAVIRDGSLVIPWVRRGSEWIEAGHQARPDGILSAAYQSGEPYRSHDLYSHPNADPEILERYDLRTQLTVPLIGPAGDHLGVVSLNNSRREAGFNARDERLLVAICETGAAVLVRARDSAVRLAAERTAAERKQEVEALLTAADRLSGAVEPEDVLARVVTMAVDMLAVRGADVVTPDGDHLVRRLLWVDGEWHPGEARLEVEDTLSGWVIRHARACRVSDLHDAPRTDLPAPIADRLHAAMSVPILGRDSGVLGALSVYDRRDGQGFTEDDERLAEGIAHHAAAAIERATLIQQLRSREEHLRTQAVTDPLTGLPNRTLFLERLAEALAAGRDAARGVAVLFLDLDGFKVVNDSLGHPVGDDLLRAVGKRLLAHQRRNDLVARFGGDEFAVLLADLADVGDAVVTAERIIAEVRRFFSLGDRGFFINASIGVSYRPARCASASAEELIREADIALYRAKATGKGHVVVFADTMGAEAVQRLELQTDLQRALRRGELVLHYQPIVSLSTKSAIGAEALLRWQHPEHGLLGPGTFIPMAEETGLILPIGRWVLEEACRQAAEWQAALPASSPFGVSVNLAVLQLEQPDLVDQVATVLRETGLEPQRLELELTESAVIKHAESAIATIGRLKTLGIRLAIDDFGTGYSSLSYLQRLAVDTLKVDQSFTKGLAPGSTTTEIVQAVIMLAHALGMSVTAEGIETAEQLTLLTALGCENGQGFLFSPACSAVELDALLMHQHLSGPLRVASRSSAG